MKERMTPPEMAPRWLRKLLGWMSLATSIAFSLAPATRADSAFPRFEVWTGPLVDFTIIANSRIFTVNFMGGRQGVLPTFGYRLNESFTAYFAPSFYLHSNGGNYIGKLMFGGGYNFSGDRATQAYYLKAFVGFDDLFDNVTSDSPRPTLKYFSWSFAAGKKFELTSDISFSPEINATFVKEDYSVVTFLSAIPVQFTLTF